PAAHLGAGIARRERNESEVLEERAHQVLAAAVVHPCVLLALIHAEGQRGVEREGLVLADEVVARRMRALDRALLQGVDHAERRHDLARGEDADLKLSAGDLLDPLGDHLASAEDRVKALREARGAAPADIGERRRLRDRLRYGKSACGGGRAAAEEFAS